MERNLSGNPSDIATPTDLPSPATLEIAQILNQIVADMLALYVKTKHVHWHGTGRLFPEIHELCDEQAQELLDAIDPVAERVRKLGRITVMSLGQAASLTVIGDETDPLLPPQAMLLHLLQDNLAVVRAIRKAIDLCDRHRDLATSNLLQEILDRAERRVWFLHASSRGIS